MGNQVEVFGRNEVNQPVPMPAGTEASPLHVAFSGGGVAENVTVVNDIESPVPVELQGVAGVEVLNLPSVQPAALVEGLGSTPGSPLYVVGVPEPWVSSTYPVSLDMPAYSVSGSLVVRRQGRLRVAAASLVVVSKAPAVFSVTTVGLVSLLEEDRPDIAVALSGIAPVRLLTVNGMVEDSSYLLQMEGWSGGGSTPVYLSGSWLVTG